MAIKNQTSPCTHYQDWVNWLHPLTIPRLILIQILFFLLIGLLTSCMGSGARYDFDKQAEFIAQFPAGMSRQDVEMRLEQFEEVTFFREHILDNGNVLLVYIVSEELYGTNEYKFYFTEELELVEVIPVLLPD